MIKKKTKSCYASYEMDSDRNTKSDMVAKATDFVVRTMERRGAKLEVNTVKVQVEKEWSLLTSNAKS